MTMPLLTCEIAPLRINPMIGPYPTVLDDWGAKNTYKMVEDGEWSRLVTPIFLHAGIIHLLGNLAIQLDQCALYEQQWGTPFYAFVYLSTGIVGGLLSLVIKPGVLGVGGSGAIMGVLGARIGEGLVKYYDKGGGIDDLKITIVSVVFVLLMSFIPFVDWPAHAGGAAAGFLLAIVLFSWKSMRSRPKCKAFSTIAGALLFLAVNFMFSSLFFIDLEPFNYLENVCEYYKEYFAQYGEDFVCECEDNRLESFYNWVKGLNGGGGE